MPTMWLGTSRSRFKITIDLVRDSSFDGGCRSLIFVEFSVLRGYLQSRMFPGTIDGSLDLDN